MTQDLTLSLADDAKQALREQLLLAIHAEADVRLRCAQRKLETPKFAGIMLDEFGSGVIQAARVLGVADGLQEVLDQRLGAIDPEFASTRAARLAASRQTVAAPQVSQTLSSWRDLTPGEIIQAGDRIKRPSGAWIVVMGNSPLIGKEVSENQLIQRKEA